MIKFIDLHKKRTKRIPSKKVTRKITQEIKKDAYHLATGLAVLALVVQLVVPVFAQAAPTSPADIWEFDGNTSDDDVLRQDWVEVTHQSFNDASNSNSDVSFKSGQKLDESNNSNLPWTTQVKKASPSKSDLTGAKFYQKVIGDELFAFVAASRLPDNGSASVGFVFSQVWGERTGNDLLLILGWKGQKEASAAGEAFLWKNGSWSVNVSTEIALVSESSVEFVEGGVNLTDLEILTNGAFSLTCPGLANLEVVTITSHSTGANLIDTIDARSIGIDLDNCAELTITKTVVNGGGETFDVSVDQTQDGVTENTLGNGDDTGVLRIPPGKVITITESASGANPNVDFTTTWDCTGDLEDSGGGTTLEITVVKFDQVTCTFTNTIIQEPDTGSITIVKQADVEGDTEFSFSSDLGDFGLTDDGTDANTTTFSDIDAGSYDFTENIPDGWDLTDVTCDANDYSTITDGVTVNLGEGENVICTFSNTLLVADIEVTKTVDNPTPTEGETITYSITVKNLGPEDATSIEVNDDLPSGVTYVSHNAGQGTYTPGTGIWDVGNLAVDDSTLLTIDVTVDNANGTITNTATRTQSSPTDDNSANDEDTADITPGARNADLAIDKLVRNETQQQVNFVDEVDASVGEVVTFLITVTNNGPDDETGQVTVNDGLSGSFIYVSDNPSKGSYDKNTGIWTFTGLTNGESETLEISVFISQAAQSQTLINTADVSGTEVDDNPDNDTDTAAVNIDPLVDIQVVKSVTSEGPYYEGSTVEFLITVTNNGPGSASDVVVSDPIPAGFIYVSHSENIGNYTTSTGEWIIGTLNTSTVATLQLILKTDQGTAESTLTNISSGSTSDEDTNSENDSDSASVEVIPVPITAADLEIQKLVNEQDEYAAYEGEIIYFTIILTNHGPATANGIIVDDVLPSEVSFGSASTTQGSYNPGTGEWDVGNLGADESAELHIQVTVGSELEVSSFVNTASVSYQDDPIEENNSDEVTVITKYTLGVSITGDGTGTVDSDDEGITCVSNEESDCSEEYSVGTVVGLTATPDEGSNFNSSWTTGAGSCTGSATPCSVTMNGNINLVAHFALNQVSPPPPPPPPSGGGGGGGGGGGSSSVGIISGTVYNDQNQNGIHDPGEPVLSGWTVYLDNNDNNVFDGGDTSAITDVNGYFEFGPLAPGTYTVREVLQTPWSITAPNGGGENEYVIVMNNTPHTLKNFGNTQGQVLGETSPPPPPQVLGETTELPRTGLPAGLLLLIPAILATPFIRKEQRVKETE